MILDINDFINKFRPLKILIAGNDYDLSELDLRDKEVIHIDKPWDSGINRKKYSGIDLCIFNFKDAVPDTILAYIAVAPYLKKGAVIVSTAQFFDCGRQNILLNVFFNIFRGEKLFINDSYRNNICGVVLPDNFREVDLSVFYMFSHKWQRKMSLAEFFFCYLILIKYYTFACYRLFAYSFHVYSKPPFFFLCSSGLKCLNLLFKHFRAADNSFTVLKISGKDKAHLNKLDSIIFDCTHLEVSGLSFLNSLILRYKPEKLCEVGVLAGATSCVMMNAMSQNPDSNLYSVELMPELNVKKVEEIKSRSHNYYNSDRMDIGFIVNDKCPQFLDKYHLYKNGTLLDYIDDIGSGIDFCFIDTTHKMPGEVFDLLILLPYLKDNAVIMLYDVLLHMNTNDEYQSQCDANSFIFSVLKGKKIIPAIGMLKKYNCRDTFNTGAVLISKPSKAELRDLFNLLLLPWAENYGRYREPAYKDKFIKFLSRHYDKELVEIAEYAFDNHKTY